MSPITPFASGAGERGREASDKAREREREQELESRGCSLEVVERGRGETSSSSPLPVSPLFVPCEAYCSPSDTKAIVRRGNANFALPSPESQRTQKRTQDAAWLSRCLSRHVETILRHAFLVALTAAHLSLFPPPDAHSHRHFSSAVWRKGRIRFGKGALFRIPPRNHGGTEEKQGGATRCGGALSLLVLLCSPLPRALAAPKPAPAPTSCTDIPLKGVDCKKQVRRREQLEGRERRERMLLSEREKKKKQKTLDESTTTTLTFLSPSSLSL